MSSQIKFWVAIGQEKQLDFEGREHSKDVPVGEQHIIYSEVLMCRQGRETIKNKLKATKQRVMTTRLHGVKLCPFCVEKFKSHPDLAWVRWIVAPEPKKSEPIKINSMLGDIK